VASDDVHASPNAHDLARRADVVVPEQPHIHSSLHIESIRMSRSLVLSFGCRAFLDTFVRFQAVMN
jgi:hypothetical protein